MSKLDIILIFIILGFLVIEGIITIIQFNIYKNDEVNKDEVK